MKMTGHNEEQIKIVKRNSNMVYRLAFSQMKNKEDADDVYQDVFLRYLKNNPCFESAEHEKAWFIRVTLNCSKTSLKSFWKTRVEELDESFEAEPVSGDDLSFALNKLSKKYRAVIHLFYYEDMSTADIANALKLKEGNVRMLLTRARRELKKILEGEDCFEKRV
ncbi:MAG: sigma-70 family RNA polymerase sigma factor [Eubacterium sp.]|nr:sigma-70 family RNA polymerase sigma factor [Eubacterium sp.]